jgi:succinate dehydrogenase / fumarate reductase membrane anchor subunit
MTTSVRRVEVKQSFETVAWKWMRYSAILLIPLVFGHVLLQDVVVGVHRMDAGYVTERWASIAIQVYDIALLAFAFSHGVNGLRQVLEDFIHGDTARKVVRYGLLAFWFILSGYGGWAIVMAMSSKIAEL